jgi:hypothetical protein
MQNAKKLSSYLNIVGWLGILSYPLSRVFLSYHSYSLVDDPDFTRTMIPIDTSTFLLDAPFNLTLPILCLWAAMYLKNKSEKLNEVFK